MLDGWVRDNPRGRHLWPGLFTSSVALPPRNWGADEIANQIDLLRTRSAQAGGHIHFSMAALMDDHGGVGARVQALNGGAALVPATPWLGATPPAAPLLQRQREQVVVSAAPGDPAQWFAVWQRQRGAWRLVLLPAQEPLRIALDDTAAVVASSVSRTGVESQRVALRVIADD